MPGGAAGSRLDRFLAAELGLSRAQVRRLLAGGAVSLAGRRLGVRDKGLALEADAELRVGEFRTPAEQRIRAEPDAPLFVLASGEGWLAVDKPAGWPVHPLEEDETGSVLNALCARHPELHGVGEGGLRSGVVHRLDVETSGALLVATQEAAWQRLRAAFRLHQVDKTYRAVVLGSLDWQADVECALIVASHRPARVRVLTGDEQDAHPRARRTSLSVRPLERLAGATLVEVRPVQGFLHQIRATLAHLGHPIAGDRRYGDEGAQDPSAARRTLLHASRVAFEDVSAESPDPEDFRAALERLRRSTDR